MKQKIKTILVIGGVAYVCYVFGKCKGVAKLADATNEVLNKNHKLDISQILFEPFRNRFDISIKKMN